LRNLSNSAKYTAGRFLLLAYIYFGHAAFKALAFR